MRTLDEIKKDIESEEKRSKEKIFELKKEYEEAERTQTKQYDLFGKPLVRGDKVIYGMTGPEDGGKLAIGTYDGCYCASLAYVITEKRATVHRFPMYLIKVINEDGGGKL